jgi:Second Messenger Oligonucleotide or Dinucleotide Synthetase domain
MYLHSSFDTFLGGIRPNQKDIDTASRAHEEIRAYLGGEGGLAQYSDSFLAGSYKRRTAITPVKDVDVVCLTTYTKQDDPVRVLGELRRVLGKNYKFDDTVANRRSVMVKLDGTPLTLDIVPAIATGAREDPILVPDRGGQGELKGWILSNPYRHVTLAEERNAGSPKIHGADSYLSAMKMLRWWRYEQWRNEPKPKQRHPKGFLIEVMGLKLMPAVASEWAELVLGTMNAIALEYGGFLGSGSAPVLDDPALRGTQIRTKMGAADFDTFLRKIDDARRTVETAIRSSDAAESARLYRAVFGDAFPLGEDGGKRAAAFPVADRNIRNSPTFA